MNPKIKPTPTDPETLHAYTARVRYRWTMPDGSVRRHHTVVLARRREGLPNAIRRFWKLNPQVDAA